MNMYRNYLSGESLLEEINSLISEYEWTDYRGLVGTVEYSNASVFFNTAFEDSYIFEDGIDCRCGEDGIRIPYLDDLLKTVGFSEEEIRIVFPENK